MKRSPMRFTIRSLQIAVLAAAIFFTLCLYVRPRAYWRELAAFLFCPMMCLLVFLIVFGTGSTRLSGRVFCSVSCWNT